MPTYRCHFPECTHTTKNRSCIDYHHITPLHMGGSNKPFNLIPLCPTHHRSIFIEGETKGIHSIKTKVSIQIKHVLESTNGKALVYTDMTDEKEKAYYFRDNTIIDM